METETPAPPATALPALKPGEHYAGLTLHDNAPHHLIILPGEVELNWKAATAWAAEQGGELPSRIDMLVCYQRARDVFQRDWYWTSEQHADGPQCAWSQYFGHGDQYADHVGHVNRVRAIRRAPI